MVSKEEAKTAGGVREVGKTPPEKEVASEGSGAKNGTEGATAVRGATLDANPEDTDAAGAGGRHMVGKRDREKVADLQ